MLLAGLQEQILLLQDGQEVIMEQLEQEVEYMLDLQIPDLLQISYPEYSSLTVQTILQRLNFQMVK
jgi:hypothetical protein